MLTFYHFAIGKGITSFNKGNGAIFSRKKILKHSGVSKTQINL